MIAEKVETQHYFAHVRDASKGMPVRQANCHPFGCMHYLWMHNGRLDQFDKFSRSLLNMLTNKAFDLIKGNTDSEYAFALFMDKLGFISNASLSQLEQAMEATIKTIMSLRKEAGADSNAFINFAVTDGYHTVVTRFATLQEAKPASLFFGQGIISDDNGVIEFTPDTSESASIICSEPPTENNGRWTKVERNHIVCASGHTSVYQRPINLPFQADLTSLGPLDLCWLNFVRDKSVLIEASGLQPSHLSKIHLTKSKTFLAEPFGQRLLVIFTAFSAFYVE